MPLRPSHSVSAVVVLLVGLPGGLMVNSRKPSLQMCKPRRFPVPGLTLCGGLVPLATIREQAWQ